MKKILVALTGLAIVVMTFFSAIRASNPQIVPPDGEVYALQAGSTLKGMQAAMNGESGTMVFVKDQMVTFIWSVNKGWAFATLNGANKTAIQDFAQLTSGKANLVSAKTIGDVRTFLEGGGWKQADPSSVPDVIRIGLGAATSWVAALSPNMTTFLLLFPGASVPEGAYKILQ